MEVLVDFKKISQIRFYGTNHGFLQHLRYITDYIYFRDREFQPILEEIHKIDPAVKEL